MNTNTITYEEAENQLLGHMDGDGFMWYSEAPEYKKSQHQPDLDHDAMMACSAYHNQRIEWMCSRPGWRQVTESELYDLLGWRDLEDGETYLKPFAMSGDELRFLQDYVNDYGYHVAGHFKASNGDDVVMVQRPIRAGNMSSYYWNLRVKGNQINRIVDVEWCDAFKFDWRIKNYDGATHTTVAKGQIGNLEIMKSGNGFSETYYVFEAKQ